MGTVNDTGENSARTSLSSLVRYTQSLGLPAVTLNRLQPGRSGHILSFDLGSMCRNLSRERSRLRKLATVATNRDTCVQPFRLVFTLVRNLSDIRVGLEERKEGSMSVSTRFSSRSETGKERPRRLVRPPAVDEEMAQAQGGSGAAARPQLPPGVQAFASAATKTRSVPARTRSTPSSASSPRRTGIRSTARRSTRISRS